MLKHIIYDRRNSLLSVVDEADMLIAQEIGLPRTVVDEDVVVTLKSIESKGMQKFFHVTVESTNDNQERLRGLTRGAFGLKEVEWYLTK